MKHKTACYIIFKLSMNEIKSRQSISFHAAPLIILFFTTIFMFFFTELFYISRSI